MNTIMEANLDALQALRREGIPMTVEDLLGTSHPLSRAPASVYVHVNEQRPTLAKVSTTPAVELTDKGEEEDREAYWSEDATPSELALLQWVPVIEDGKGPSATFRSPHLDIVRAVLAEAILANEQAPLELVYESSFFGLITTTRLKTICNNSGIWPRLSVESGIVSYGVEYVSEIVERWIGARAVNPRRDASRRIIDSMVFRGLVRAEVTVEPKKWLFFRWTETHTAYVATDKMISSAQRKPRHAPGELLAACQRSRPAVYKRLLVEIDTAFFNRTVCSD